MNEVVESLKMDCCHGCLCKNDESMLRSYTIQHQALKSLLKVERLSLCSICQRLARHFDVFIQNVQSNQIFLENFHSITESNLDNVRSQIQPVLNLSCVPQDTIHLSGVDDGNIEDPFSMIYNCGWNKNAKIKVELKDEGPDSDHHLEELIGDNDFQDTFMKEEDFPLAAFIKKELQFEELDPKYVKKLRSGAVIKQVVSKNNKVKKKREETIKIETIKITKKQCMEERETQAQDERYLDLPYKCEDCIKGFNFKEAYDRHREKHSKEMGDYECDICKQRMSSEERLKAHRKYHELRYKCGECDFTRVCRLSVQEHYRAEHSDWERQYHCPHCSKSFKKLKSMRKHNSYAHSKKERVTCALCLKTYATKEVLKTHMIRRHASELPAGAGAGATTARRRHVCETCGARFGMPSLLSQHRVKHSLRRDYYCVECDKSFKTDAILKHHLKTASPHVTYNELPLACSHCEKRFSIKRDLQRHTNSVHLKIKPFQCDKCDRAYVNGWSLTEHKRLSHEGYKRPLKYPCTLCDKVFDRNQILKEHMRTHTGERPYQCARCPAQFAQGSALGTHMKLVHLKLTRDGRPKAQRS